MRCISLLSYDYAISGPVVKVKLYEVPRGFLVIVCGMNKHQARIIIIFLRLFPFVSRKHFYVIVIIYYR